MSMPEYLTSPPLSLSLCLLLSASVCRVASFSFNYSCCFNKRCAAFGHFIKRQAPPASSPSFLVDFAATFWGNQSPGKCTYEHTESTEREWERANAFISQARQNLIKIVITLPAPAACDAALLCCAANANWKVASAECGVQLPAN